MAVTISSLTSKDGAAPLADQLLPHADVYIGGGRPLALHKCCTWRKDVWSCSWLAQVEEEEDLWSVDGQAVMVGGGLGSPTQVWWRSGLDLGSGGGAITTSPYPRLRGMGHGVNGLSVHAI
eukprot:scaffold19826_cov17-Tisochrysis_lutea.AAC.1